MSGIDCLVLDGFGALGGEDFCLERVIADFTDFAINLGDIRVLGEGFDANLDGEMLLPSGKLLFWTFG